MADKPPAYDYQQQGYQQQGYQQPYDQPPPSYQATSSVTVAVAQQPQVVYQTVAVERRKTNHLLHCLITFFVFWPWVFVWIYFCVTDP
jgi:hypothetical protein